jgi:hypothetical protein
MDMARFVSKDSMPALPNPFDGQGQILLWVNIDFFSNRIPGIDEATRRAIACCNP